MACQNSYLDYTQSEFIEKLYEKFKQDPNSIDFGWKKFFEGMEFGMQTPVLTPDTGQGTEMDSHRAVHAVKELAVLNLIHDYRARGHMVANINPFGQREDLSPRLDLKDFKLTEADLDTSFNAGSEIGIGPSTLRNILQHLKDTYCSSIGVEYTHLRKWEVFSWLQKKMEHDKNSGNFDIQRKRRILQKLNEAEVFETFLQTKYVGQKRFSLEGAESLIPALDTLVQRGTEQGIRYFMIGMAHRGRLNVLANILQKTYESIFSEFEDYQVENSVVGMGDVKYHKGYNTILKTHNEESIKLSLAFNPSHLEAIDPVVEGLVRSKAEQYYDNDFTKIIPILIHGDAALSGQGVVYETLEMSELPGYKTGGTIHLVINNHIGFTTDFTESRSSLYCTDVAKTIRAPIFHVNGNDPEAVVYCMDLAVEFRQKFARDIFIDICCYRKYGHNETDEPRFTQPLMYKKIDQMQNPRQAYVQQLTSQGIVETRLTEELEKEFKELLQQRLNRVKESKKGYEVSVFESRWSGFRVSKKEDFHQSPDTSVSADTLQKIGQALITLPPKFTPIAKVGKILENRKHMLEQGRFNWEMGEAFAYGSLLVEGFPVRLSGQDSQRGTFSHRHAVIKDEHTEEKHVSLNHILSAESGKKQALFQVYNSPLSEYAVLGFDYGYSLAGPNRLTIWEAQFGDFCNGAQIMIDQFISSSQEKWGRSTGIVMLLPHGYEGQGPEHSSARIERFLQLAAQRNMYVTYCSTPANFFHVLRRQMKLPFRIPVVVFTPKSMLRNPRCVSPLEDFTKGGFKEVIADPTADPEKVTTIQFCWGKIYYELLEEKEKNKREDVAIVRLEQLYPLPSYQIKLINVKYKKCKKWLWVQEEPENMGAWYYMVQRYRGSKLELVARPKLAAPAEGSHTKHHENQHEIIRKAFA
jgi:2-oxoglutarate dehydrogenase E1 component